MEQLMSRPPSIHHSEYSFCSCTSMNDQGSLSSTGHTTPIDPTLMVKQQQALTVEIGEAWKLHKQPLRRRHVAHELLQTEQEYVNDLEYLSEVCFKALMVQDWITHEHKLTIIRNANDIVEFNRRFLKALENCLETTGSTEKDACQSMAHVFLDMMDEFMVYTYYCNMHTEALALYADYRTRPEWNVFLKMCTPFNKRTTSSTTENALLVTSTSTITTKPLHFEDYLIKPVQRICRYPLLIKDMLRYTPPHAEEYSLLTNALTSMQSVVAAIDLQKHIRDIKERTDLFVKRVENDGKISKQFLSKLGSLTMAGALEVSYIKDGQTFSKSKYLGCFLFPSYLILVRPKKSTVYEPKHWFSLRQGILEDNADSDKQQDNNFAVHVNDYVFTFTASCSQEKQLWVKRIKEAIESTALQGSDIPADSCEAENALDSSFSESPSSLLGPTMRHSKSLTNILDFSAPNSTTSSQTKSSHLGGIKRSASSNLLLGETNKGKGKLSRTPSPPKIEKTGSHFPKSNSFHHLSLYKQEANVNNGPSGNTRIAIETMENGVAFRRPSSLDLLMTSNTSTNVIGKMSSQLKNSHRHTQRMTTDEKLRDVYTQDYLSSRAWHTRDKDLLMPMQATNYSHQGNFRKRKSTPFMRSSPSNLSLFLSRRASEADLAARAAPTSEEDTHSIASIISSIEEGGSRKTQGQPISRRVSQLQQSRITVDTSKNCSIDQTLTAGSSPICQLEENKAASVLENFLHGISYEDQILYDNFDAHHSSAHNNSTKTKPSHEKRAFLKKIIRKIKANKPPHSQTQTQAQAQAQAQSSLHLFQLPLQSLSQTLQTSSSSNISYALKRHSSDLKKNTAHKTESNYKTSVSDPTLLHTYHQTYVPLKDKTKLKHKNSFFGRILKDLKPFSQQHDVQSPIEPPPFTAFSYASTPARPYKTWWRQKLGGIRHTYSA
ncbi:hypothetical protein BDF14DRAFT_1794204 [Spinellus fusiger]|nr:hypothetical protein BDF14DRAFT_1794204 [Spinellus fusiger]